jgi:uncharacterized protein YbjT (DUF2867 family)
MARLVTTPTGNTGRHVLATVREADPDVRVLVRDPARLGAAAPADVVTGDLRDGQALTRALSDIDAAFFCVPQSPNPDDLLAYYASFAEPFAAAAREAGVARVVTISGGQDESGAGPGLALRATERTPDTTGANARHIRCGYFMENLLWQAEAIAGAGLFSLPLDPEAPLAFVATRDIGVAAGQLLLDDGWSGVGVRTAYGPRKLVCREAAEILSEALGRPVRYVPAAREAWAAQLQGFGLSHAMAHALKDMFAAIERGEHMGGPDRDPVDCPTTLDAWAREVLAPVIAKAGATA